MRIVLDTNVVLSAWLWRGTPYQLLVQVRASLAVRLVSSPALFTELADVLSRPWASQRLRLVDRTLQSVLEDYLAVVTMVELPTVVPRVVRDVDDDQVIATAVAAHADFVVSGDTDLLCLEQHQGIPIISVAQALDRVSQPNPSHR